MPPRKTARSDHRESTAEMFFRRRNIAEIVQGAFYERIHNDNLVERAEVVWVGNDSFGIPHVRYRMSYRTPSREEGQGTRMLAQTIFSERYRQVKEAGAQPVLQQTVSTV